MGTRVYMGRVAHRATERDIERFFKGYGRIKEVILKNGYGFVEFEEYRDADDAVYDLNGKDLMGERVTIEMARGTPRGRDRYGWRPPPRGSRSGRDDRDRDRGGDRDRDRGGDRDRDRDRGDREKRSEYRLIVENLSSRVASRDLKDYFKQAGEVLFADVNSKRNEGVIEFASKSHLKAAIEKLDGMELNGRKIKLREDKRKSKSKSRSRSRSRSRSPRSRSRSREKSKSRSRSPSKEKEAMADGEKAESDRRSGSRSRSPAGDDDKMDRNGDGGDVGDGDD